MTCKPFINAVNTGSQVLLAGAPVAFTAVPVGTGCGITFNGSNTFTISRAGVYAVSFDADVDPTTTGSVETVLTNNGTNVPCAAATFTGTATDIVHIHLQGAVKVLTSCKCVDNAAVLQVLVNDGATITNPNITIEAVKA